MRKTAAVVLGILLSGATSVALAAEVPRMTWLRAKCALCHGEDGSGNTPEGKKRKVPDLRSEAIRKLSDAELTKLIVEGHSRMPSFKVQLNQEQINAIVVYIRSMVKK
jgi:mono/diheme cytochrome c family protein